MSINHIKIIDFDKMFENQKIDFEKVIQTDKMLPNQMERDNEKIIKNKINNKIKDTEINNKTKDSEIKDTEINNQTKDSEIKDNKINIDKIDNNLKFILDPLSIIIKLAILSKKDVGTKICVYNNVLYIQEIGVFQSFVRYMFKNNKIDIQYLYNPIELACKFYLNDKNDKNNLNIKLIFISAQEGIKKLIKTYHEHLIIVHTLYFYYNIIENYLCCKYNERLFMSDSFSIYYTDNLIEKFNSQWTREKIKIVLEMIEFINNDNSDLNKSIKCFEEFMIIIDNNVNTLL